MIENKSLGSKIFDALNVVFLVIVMLICIMLYGMSSVYP